MNHRIITKGVARQEQIERASTRLIVIPIDHMSTSDLIYNRGLAAGPRLPVIIFSHTGRPPSCGTRVTCLTIDFGLTFPLIHSPIPAAAVD